MDPLEERAQFKGFWMDVIMSWVLTDNDIHGRELSVVCDPRPFEKILCAKNNYSVQDCLTQTVRPKSILGGCYEDYLKQSPSWQKLRWQLALFLLQECGDSFLQVDGIIYSAASSACQKSVLPGLARLLDRALNFGRGLSRHMGVSFKYIHRMSS